PATAANRSGRQGRPARRRRDIAPVRVVYRQRYGADAHGGGGGHADPGSVRSEPQPSVCALGGIYRAGALGRSTRGDVWSGLRPSHHGHADGRSLGRCRRGRRAPPVGGGRKRRRVSESGRASLSALVVVHNEERQLGDCLSSLDFADEIVVVLDRCCDRSREIAQGFTAQLVEGAWEREGPRRHPGIAACRGDWIIEIDADERVSPELAAEIRRTIAASPAAWHLIPVDNYV